MISDNELMDLIKYMFSLVESDTARKVVDQELSQKYGKRYQHLKAKMITNEGLRIK